MIQSRDSGWAFLKWHALWQSREMALQDLHIVKDQISWSKITCSSEIARLETLCKEMESRMATEDPKSVLNYREYELDAQGNKIPDYINGGHKKTAKNGRHWWIKIESKSFDPDDGGSPFDKLKDHDVIKQEKDTNGRFMFDVHWNPIMIKIAEPGIETQLNDQIKITQEKQSEKLTVEAKVKEEEEMEKFYREQITILAGFKWFDNHKEKILELKEKKSQKDWLVDQSDSIRERQTQLTDLKARQEIVSNDFKPQLASLEKEKDMILDKLKGSTNWDYKFLLENVNKRIEKVTDAILTEKNRIASLIDNLYKEIADLHSSQNIAKRESENLEIVIEWLEEDLKYHKEIDEQRDFLRKKIDSDIDTNIKNDQITKDLMLQVANRRQELGIERKGIEKRKAKWNKAPEAIKAKTDINNRIKELKKEKELKKKEMEKIKKDRAEEIAKEKTKLENEKKIINSKATKSSRDIKRIENIDGLLWFSEDRFIFFVPKLSSLIISLDQQIKVLGTDVVDITTILSTKDNHVLDPMIAWYQSIIAWEDADADVEDINFSLNTDENNDSIIKWLNNQIEQQKAQISSTAKALIPDRNDENHVKVTSISQWYSWPRGHISHPNAIDELIEANNKSINACTKNITTFAAEKSKAGTEYDAEKSKEDLIRVRYEKSLNKHYGWKDKAMIEAVRSDLYATEIELASMKARQEWLRVLLSEDHASWIIVDRIGQLKWNSRYDTVWWTLGSIVTWAAEWIWKLFGSWSWIRSAFNKGKNWTP